MLKKLFILPALLVGALVLTGCEIDNENMSKMIEECKQDEECMEIINQEIDSILEERGVFDQNEFGFFEDEYFEGYDYYDFYDLELSEEEQEMLDIIMDLDEEYFSKIDGEYVEYTIESIVEDYETVIGRVLTDLEKEALQLMMDLYESNDNEDIFIEMSEIEYLEYFIERSLTETEIEALELVEQLYLESFYDDIYVEHDFDDEINWEDETEVLEYYLGRTLTEAEVEALELVDNLYNLMDDNYFEKDMELLLGRELTEEEVVAINLVSELDNEYFENLDYDFEFTIEDMIEDYETVLDRELTELEIAALEYFYDFDGFETVEFY